MKIAYLSHQNPRSKKDWSGIHYNMLAMLNTDHEVFVLGPVYPVLKRVLKIASFILKKSTGKKFLVDHSLMLSKKYAQIFEKKIQEIKPDLIFAPNASTEIAMIETDIPIIYLSGGTFKLLTQYYPEYSNLTKTAVKNGQFIEKRALQKASRIIFPTKWAANSAIDDYGIDKKKINIIPYGANVVLDAPSIPEEKLSAEKVRLLLVGIDWERKGVPIALEAFKALKDKKIDVRLDICGCLSETSEKEEGVHYHGFLSKDNKQELEKLKVLYKNSTFFILPTRSENFGVSFVEAFAAGIPALGTRTGGVPSIIENGRTGFLFELSDKGEAYADKIIEALENKELYSNLCKNARAAYLNKFNWNIWYKSVNRIIDELYDK